MPDHVVISHTLDEAAGVYRLEVGIPIVEEVIVDQREVEATPHGIDVEAVEAAGDEVPRTTILEDVVEERTVGYAEVEDFVFAADDERWLTRAGKPRPARAIAGEQRNLALEALQARRNRRPPAPTAELPGIGEALTA